MHDSVLVEASWRRCHKRPDIRGTSGWSQKMSVKTSDLNAAP